jgi:DNA polymerase III epsilon subunit-like protein
MAQSAMDERLVFLDIETGGLDPRRHPIIQVAAIAVGELFEPLEAVEFKIRFDDRKACKHSLRKNHYSRGLWALEAQSDRAAAFDLAAFFKRHATCPMQSANGKEYRVAQLVAHNAAFDSPFLQAWYERLGLYLPASRQVLCTLQRAMWYFTEQPHLARPRDFKLATLCQHFGVAFHAASAHDALADVSATVQLYRAMDAARQHSLIPLHAAAR